MSEFVEFLRETLSVIGEIRARKMFGGHGLFCNDLMIGLVADDTLYLKVDRESAPLFVERGSTPFEYMKNGKAMHMSYYLAPEEIYDDPDEAKHWASLAYAAAVRSKKVTLSSSRRRRFPRPNRSAASTSPVTRQYASTSGRHQTHRAEVR